MSEPLSEEARKFDLEAWLAKNPYEQPFSFLGVAVIAAQRAIAAEAKVRRLRAAVAAEREACAKVTEAWSPECYQAEGIAAAIRARGAPAPTPDATVPPAP